MEDNETTKRIKRVLTKRFSNHNRNDFYCLLNEEVRVGDSKKRVDLGGFEFFDGEIDSSIGIEIKTSKADFYSGCGRNFDFEWNYLAVPTELISLAIRMLRRWNKKYVGVIEVDGNSNVHILKNAIYHCSSKVRPINQNGQSYLVGYPIHTEYVDSENGTQADL